MRRRAYLIWIVIIFLFLQRAEAVLVPPLDLDSLCDSAPFIVVGQVISVAEVGRTSVPFGNRTVPARSMVAEIRVDQVLKGAGDFSSPLRCRFTVTDEFIGWRSISSLSYRVFFLTDEFNLANPFYPSAAAIPGAEIQPGDPNERVIGELIAVVESAKAPIEEKREAVFAIASSKKPQAIRALNRVAGVKDVGLQLSVSAALLGHNDISTLQFAVDTLLKPDPALSQDLLHNLSYAIFEGVKDERAVAALTRLLRTGRSESRRAAASALTHTGTTSCIDPLLLGINDPDFEVRYYSAVGLAEITGQMEWHPNMDDFTSAQEKYLRHWREWSKSR